MNKLEHNLNHKAPPLILEDSKRVKILATVGPATSSKQKIEEMFAAGTDGFRLNFSHGTHAEKKRATELIRSVSASTGKPVAIIQDLHGPKIALSNFDHPPIDLAEGSFWHLQFQGALDTKLKVLPVEFDLSKNVQPGQPVFIDDGRIKASVYKIDDVKAQITIQIEHGGLVKPGKGLNLPETDFTGHIITQKDIQDVNFGAKLGFDYVALSFVQTPEDVLYFRNLLNSLGSRAKIISKIETKKATQNLEQIVQVSDGIMVARGDLAVEVGPESVPVLQRQIVGLCAQNKKIVIVATQMLASMTISPEPTRAEVSDIATAVIIGTDCVMLSEETAIGNFPIQAISTMKRVILYTQKHNNVKAVFKNKPHQATISEAIANSIIHLAEIVTAIAIVVESTSGQSVLDVASNRPERPVLAVTEDQITAQQLAIVYGVKSFIRPVEKFAATKLTNWLRRGGVLNTGDVIITASGQYPGKVGGTDTIKVRVI
jgi:pyruvate kinase